MTTIGIVGCSKTKLAEPAPAKDLYTSPLFRAARAYCEATYDRWYILSAKYGLVEPDQMIEPYDVTLRAMNVKERHRWATDVAGSKLAGEIAMVSYTGGAVCLHAGALYRQAFSPHGLNITIHVPLLGHGIGQQLAWYANRAAERAQ